MASSNLLDRAHADTTNWMLLWNRYVNHQPRRIADVGANVGLYSYWFARNLPKTNIVAFEPVKLMYESLVENMKNFNNVETANFALWSSSTNLTMGMPNQRNSKIDKLNTGMYTACLSRDDMHDIVDARAMMLDEFVVMKNLESGFDMIKLDVEGAELEVLKGMPNTLKNDVKCAVIERNNKTRLNDYPSYVHVASHMSDMGFVLVHQAFDDVWIRDELVRAYKA